MKCTEFVVLLDFIVLNERVSGSSVSGNKLLLIDIPMEALSEVFQGGLLISRRCHSDKGLQF